MAARPSCQQQRHALRLPRGRYGLEVSSHGSEQPLRHTKASVERMLSDLHASSPVA